MQTLPNHPAPFTESVLAQITAYVRDEATRRRRPPRLLDPFAGIGLIHQLAEAELAYTVGVELEPEWALQHPRTFVGSVLSLPFPDGAFELVGTSPCLAQDQRILTADLRWVPAGDIEVDDSVMAFDEHGAPGTNGYAARRRWQRATVVRSFPQRQPAVRVILDNGDEVVTTPEHPWLAHRYGYRHDAAEWTPSSRLLERPWVLRQVEPWRERRSYDAGWLAGMYDGEGALSLGQHGSPKLTLYQALGPVLDHAERLMEDFGYQPNRIVRKDTPEHRQKIGNLYAGGGFPGIMRALGELRPRRLLAKWETLDVSTRTVQAERVCVVAVEDAGMVDIQVIETTAGTYIGEGYLMHNCYGNRFADSHVANDSCKRCKRAGTVDGKRCQNCRGSGISRRRSYRHDLGRMPSRGSAAVLQWGDAYRSFHERAWRETVRVLRPGGVDDPNGGRLILNISDHYRNKQLVPVSDWHVITLGRLGMIPIAWKRVPTPRMKQGQNYDSRAGHENVIVFARAA